MDLKQALERIEELERRVKELEARGETHHHHYYVQPALPAPPYYPTWIGPTCNTGAGFS